MQTVPITYGLGILRGAWSRLSASSFTSTSPGSTPIAAASAAGMASGASAGRDALDRLLDALNWRRGAGEVGGEDGEAAKASAGRAALTYGFPQGFLWSVYRDPSIGPYLVQTWGHIQAALDPAGTYRP